MLKRSVVMFLVVALIAGVFTLAVAQPDGNHRKGKYLFRKNCRSCHIDGGAANVLEPATYTMEEWTKAFAPENVANYPCQGDWPESESDILDIYTYMYKFAKDSPTPAKCS